MPTINYVLSGTKNPSQIKIRFLNGRQTDFSTGTNVFIDPKFWDKKNQKIKNVILVPDRDKINVKLIELKLQIFSSLNVATTEGEIINKFWLDKVISTFFKRPEMDDKKVIQYNKVYFSDFSQFWIDNKAKKYKVSADKYMDDTTISHYKILVNLIKKFEGKDKIKFNAINEKLLDDFSEFLTAENYAEKTAKRMIGRFKFFCIRAESENIIIDQSYKNRVFVKKQDSEYKEPYFDEVEIVKIFKHDFTKAKELENARDNLIIGLWTGLRVSDFLSRLKISNFNDDFIEIQTEKTKTFVSIPVHWMIREILQKRNGNLPEKISDQKFNKHIKTISKLLNFNQKMLGGVVKVDEKTKIKRKVVDFFEKHELVTSHICRRSFATNIYGTVSNSTLMSICGWKSEEQMLDYIKKTNREHAETLKKVWDQKYKNVI